MKNDIYNKYCLIHNNRHESGSLMLSGTVKHINSGDEEWARGRGGGYRTQIKENLPFMEMEINTFNV